MKNNWLGEDDAILEPKKGILQSGKKKIKSTVRFVDKEVTAQVDKEGEKILISSL